jgi:predicted transcriptional regulator
MRTTVNIDDNLLAEAKSLAARTHRPLGAIIDDGIRALRVQRQNGQQLAETIELPADGGSGFVAGVDLEDREQLAEILGDNSC